LVKTKTKYTIAVVALVLGTIMTTGAFISTFFVAGVSDYGQVSSAKSIESVRYRGDSWDVLSVTDSDLTGFVGYDTKLTVVVPSTVPSSATGAASTAATKTADLAGTIKSATDSAVTVDLGASGGTKTFQKTEITAISVHSYNYGRADWGQKIFYFHVPIAVGSFLIFLIAAYFAVRFLMTKNHEYDTRSRIAMEVSFLFILLTMGTGILWTKAAWGVWWEWEPRLTTYAILTLLTVAYFVLRSTVEDDERRATYAAAFCILAAIDVPISFGITRVLPSTHPVIEKSGLEGPMLATFLVGMFGMMMIAYVFYELRLREEFMREKLEVIKTALEG
jgi:heme exporter protein C